MTRKVTLPKFSRREQRAHAAESAWTDTRVPDAAIRLLRKLRITDPGALDAIGDSLGDHRVLEQWREARLQASERRAQAQATIDVIRDLRARIRGLDSELEQRMDLALMRLPQHDGTPFASLWREQVDPVLVTTEALLMAAATEIPTATRGRKPATSRVFQTVLRLVEAHTDLGKTAAREKAREIVQACGIAMPATERGLRRRTGQN